jgi:hypothetical protein
VAGSCEQGNELWSYINGREFPYELGEGFYRMELVPCISACFFGLDVHVLQIHI